MIPGVPGSGRSRNVVTRSPSRVTTPARDASGNRRSIIRPTTCPSSRAAADSNAARLVSNSESPLHSKNRSASRSRAWNTAPPVPARRGSLEIEIATGRGSVAWIAGKARSISSDKYPVNRTKSDTPKRINSRISQARKGRPPRVSSGLGVVSVSDPRRVPRPPARMAHWVTVAGSIGCLIVERATHKPPPSPKPRYRETPPHRTEGPDRRLSAH